MKIDEDKDTYAFATVRLKDLEAGISGRIFMIETKQDGLEIFSDPNSQWGIIGLSPGN